MVARKKGHPQGYEDEYSIRTFGTDHSGIDGRILKCLHKSLQGKKNEGEIKVIERTLLRKSFKEKQPVPLGVADGFDVRLTHKLYGGDSVVVDGGPINIGLCPCAVVDNKNRRKSQLDFNYGHGPMRYEHGTRFFPMLFYDHRHPLIVNGVDTDKYIVSATATFRNGGICSGNVPLNVYNVRDISRLTTYYPSIRRQTPWKDPKYEELKPPVTFSLVERQIIEF